MIDGEASAATVACFEQLYGGGETTPTYPRGGRNTYIYPNTGLNTDTHTDIHTPATDIADPNPHTDPI